MKFLQIHSFWSWLKVYIYMYMVPDVHSLMVHVECTRIIWNFIMVLIVYYIWMCVFLLALNLFMYTCIYASIILTCTRTLYTNKYMCQGKWETVTSWLFFYQKRKSLRSSTWCHSSLVLPTVQSCTWIKCHLIPKIHEDPSIHVSFFVLFLLVSGIGFCPPPPPSPYMYFWQSLNMTSKTIPPIIQVHFCAKIIRDLFTDFVFDD